VFPAFVGFEIAAFCRATYFLLTFMLVKTNGPDGFSKENS
jgi:hypothetical protein